MARLSVEIKVRDHGRRVLAHVLEARGDVVATFDFLATSRKEPLRLVGLALKTTSPGGQIRVTDIRKFYSLGEWEEAARLAAAGELRAIARRNVAPKKPASEERSRKTPPYEEVANRYRELTRAGVRHPSAQLADEMGVSLTSAWNWMRRCRELGLLAPAPGQGVAGEVVEVGAARQRQQTQRAKRTAAGEGGRL